MSGKLWIVGTPIGNRDDISPRAIGVLRESEIILAEDTRVSARLFSLLGFKSKHIITYCDYMEQSRLPEIIQLLESGKVVSLVCDAGMPAISDPGYLLVQESHLRGIPVSVVPGPSSIVTALSGSGIAPIPFTFLGFLPRGRGEREQIFKNFSQLDTSLVLFERKNRVTESLQIGYSILGERDVCIARELTKIHEEYIHFRLSKLEEKELELKGEVTIVISRPLQKIKSRQEDIFLHYMKLEPGLSRREQVKALRELITGYSSKELYAILETIDNHKR